MAANFDLPERLALITGSSRGLGWAFAQALADAGARVILHARNQVALEARVQEMRDRGTPAADTVCFDVRDGPGTVAAFAQIGRAHGRLDILINNAGGTVRKPVLETTDEDWQGVIDVDLSACFRIAREALRLMVPQGKGRIIMISSIMGHLARPTIPAYIAAKTGLHGLVRALAVEFGQSGVTVNAIAPGYFAVPGNQSLRDDPAFNEWILSSTPMRRWGVVGELDGAAVFLCSDAAAFVTGTVITVDGGFTASL